MTIDELLTKYEGSAAQVGDPGTITKSEILRDIHSLNNIECKIGNPEWYMLSLTKLRRMISKISDDLGLNSSKICEMSKQKILKILFSIDVMFQCYTYSFEQCIHDKNRLITDPEIQKKFIYLGATMGKDFSYLLNSNMMDLTLRTCIENKYFGKFTDFHNLTKYALAYENFENENKYECMLKQLRQRQIFQEQQLQEIRRQIQYDARPERPRLRGKIIACFARRRSEIGKWLLKFNPFGRDPCTASRSGSTSLGKGGFDDLLIDASCSVCYVSKKNILFTECGHISACLSCSDKLGFKCPMCRKMSDSKMLVFY